MDTLISGQNALLSSLIDALAASDAASNGPNLFEGLEDENSPGAQRARRAALSMRAQRLMLPTIVTALHLEREPLMLKVEAALPRGWQSVSTHYMWVDEAGRVVFDASSDIEALQWAWEAGYRLPDQETWTLDTPAAPPAEQWLTPAEAAELSGTSESHWRNRCAAGQVDGAFKKGKQWLIPRASVARQRGE
jgi:hypothetical protein